LQDIGSLCNVVSKLLVYIAWIAQLVWVGQLGLVYSDRGRKSSLSR